jgi:hypothetical protein
MEIFQEQEEWRTTASGDFGEPWNALGEVQAGGCWRSTELLIAPRRPSWREMFPRKGQPGPKYEAKTLARRRVWKKTLGGKVQNQDFPTELGNPAKDAGFPLFPHPRLLLVLGEFCLSLTGKND